MSLTIKELVVFCLGFNKDARVLVDGKELKNQYGLGYALINSNDHKKLLLFTEDGGIEGEDDETI